MVKAHLILLISLSLSQEEVEMGLIVTYIQYTPKSKNLKNFYYLGAKAWNSLPINLRNMSDQKVFGKNFKSRLLDSVINDPNYIVNNAYDYIYKLDF